MPTFQQPENFYSLYRVAPLTTLTVSDMAGIVADHLRNFIAAPAAYANLSIAAVAGLLSSLEVYTDPEKLLQSGVEEWIFVTPSPNPIKSTQQFGLTDVGATIYNSKAPLPLNDTYTMHLEAGTLPNKGLYIVERNILISISAGTRAGTFRAADAVYLWMTDMLPAFNLEFGSRQTIVSPVQLPGEAEKPIFAGFAGNPAMMINIALRNTWP